MKSDYDIKVAIAAKAKRKANLIRYRKDPKLYFFERFGIPLEHIKWSLLPEYANHKWDGTKDPLERICKNVANSKWTGVESGSGVGKTFLGALLIFYFLENFENSLVVTTAPKAEQLRLHIWKEISMLYPQFGKGELLNLQLRMIPNRDYWKAVGFVAGVRAEEVQASATKAQGLHAEHMLIIFEETTGIHDAVMTALQNNCVSPHNIIVAFGNPDHQHDSLHRFCQQDGVEHIRISGFDHPNVVLKNPNYIPGAQTEFGLDKILKRYHNDTENPLYLSRARGISPSQGFDSVIRLEWIMDCLNIEVEPGNNYFIGVDVANSIDGDEASIAEGDDNRLTSIKSFPCPNANQLGRLIGNRIREMGINPEHVGVDGVGVGAGTVNTLLEENLQVVNIQSGSAPIDIPGETEQFNNLRSQIWWTARRDLENKSIALPHDDELISDLVTPKWFTRNGKICIEAKDEIKKRLGRSPNKGDAFVYWNWVRRQKLSYAYTSGIITLEDEGDINNYDEINESLRRNALHLPQKSFWEK